MKDKAQSTVAESVPSEIWNQIRSYLPIFPRSASDSVLGYSENHHLRIWHSIFKKEDFLDEATKNGVNPVLIGYDLNKQFHSKNNKMNTKTSYLVLVLAFDGHGGRWNTAWETDSAIHLLYDTLQPHVSTGVPREYLFPESGIILNLESDPEFKLRTIGPKDVKGIGKGSTKKNVSRIVALSWVHLPSNEPRQHVFAVPGTVEFQTDSMNNGERGHSFRVTSWKWKESWSIWSPNGYITNRKKKGSK
ncbi:hypothetical protein DL98DRAFT_542023 [Cadophora sp. DSE1049]|nr:hypothetical protein DL98DRAFT_542023 [Cadophora sp. DSE1049]